jgi:hypothetical protein
MSAGTVIVEFSKPLSGLASWWGRKTPWETAIWSTSPAMRSAPLPRMAQPTSLPTMVSSISTFVSYWVASWTALSSSSFPCTLVTPKEDPERAGFTTTGKVISAGSTSSAVVTIWKPGVAIPALVTTA